MIRNQTSIRTEWRLIQRRKVSKKLISVLDPVVAVVVDVKSVLAMWRVTGMAARRMDFS